MFCRFAMEKLDHKLLLMKQSQLYNGKIGARRVLFSGRGEDTHRLTWARRGGGGEFVKGEASETSTDKQGGSSWGVVKCTRIYITIHCPSFGLFGKFDLF